jgi:hypothetical protein
MNEERSRLGEVFSKASKWTISAVIACLAVLLIVQSIFYAVKRRDNLRVAGYYQNVVYDMYAKSIYPAVKAIDFDDLFSHVDISYDNVEYEYKIVPSLHETRSIFKHACDNMLYFGGPYPQIRDSEGSYIFKIPGGIGSVIRGMTQNLYIVGNRNYFEEYVEPFRVFEEGTIPQRVIYESAMKINEDIMAILNEAKASGVDFVPLFNEYDEVNRSNFFN